jgi:hypothetical protein
MESSGVEDPGAVPADVVAGPPLRVSPVENSPPLQAVPASADNHNQAQT